MITQEHVKTWVVKYAKVNYRNRKWCVSISFNLKYECKRKSKEEAYDKLTDHIFTSRSLMKQLEILESFYIIWSS